MSKLLALTHFSCEESENGNAKVIRAHLDLNTRRMVPQTVLEFENGGPELYTADEMILAAVAGRVAQYIYQRYELP